MPPSYQRARSPDQKAERRALILAAAWRLLEEVADSRELSLNELARRVGMAKSHLYRYFESREAVLLALLADATERWAGEIVAALATLDPTLPMRTRLTASLRLVASTAAARPRLCHLMSVLPSVLEHNASLDTVRDFKLESIALLGRLCAALHGVVPELSPEAHQELLHHAFAYIVGAWPLAHPSPVTEEVMADPALAPFRHDFEADLGRVLELMALGLLATAGSSGVERPA